MGRGGNDSSTGQNCLGELHYLHGYNSYMLMLICIYFYRFVHADSLLAHSQCLLYNDPSAYRLKLSKAIESSQHEKPCPTALFTCKIYTSETTRVLPG